jgi:hypothetical protein
MKTDTKRRREIKVQAQNAVCSQLEHSSSTTLDTTSAETIREPEGQNLRDLEISTKRHEITSFVPIFAQIRSQGPMFNIFT